MTLKKPKIVPPKLPLPKELVINDLVEGSGPETEPGDVMTVDYLGVNKHGKERFDSWGNETPFSFTLGKGEYFQGWEEGLEGMKVGGRRELIIPSRLTEKRGLRLGLLVYVVDLRKVE